MRLVSRLSTLIVPCLLILTSACASAPTAQPGAQATAPPAAAEPGGPFEGPFADCKMGPVENGKQHIQCPAALLVVRGPAQMFENGRAALGYMHAVLQSNTEPGTTDRFISHTLEIGGTAYPEMIWRTTRQGQTVELRMMAWEAEQKLLQCLPADAAGEALCDELLPYAVTQGIPTRLLPAVMASHRQ